MYCLLPAYNGSCCRSICVNVNNCMHLKLWVFYVKVHHVAPYSCVLELRYGTKIGLWRFFVRAQCRWCRIILIAFMASVLKQVLWLTDIFVCGNFWLLQDTISLLDINMKELGSCLPLRDNGVRTLLPTRRTVVLTFETYKSYHVVSHTKCWRV